MFGVHFCTFSSGRAAFLPLLLLFFFLLISCLVFDFVNETRHEKSFPYSLLLEYPLPRYRSVPIVWPYTEHGWLFGFSCHAVHCATMVESDGKEDNKRRFS